MSLGENNIIQLNDDFVELGWAESKYENVCGFNWFISSHIKTNINIYDVDMSYNK